MPAIDIPDPLPPSITPDREVIEFFIERHLAEFGDDSLVARTWHWVLHGGGPRRRSATWTGPVRRRRATISRHPRRRKHRQRATPLTRPPPGTSSTGPGSSAGCAPPSPKTNSRCASTPGTPRPHPPPPKKARSPSPCARFPTTDGPTAPVAKAAQQRHARPREQAMLHAPAHSRSLYCRPSRTPAAETAMIIRWCIGVKRNGSWFNGDRTGDQDQKGRSVKTGIRDPVRS